MLEIARRAADRIVADFQGKGPAYTPGHEEIELALIRLHAVTPGDTASLGPARQFIEQRGRTPHFGWLVFLQWLSTFQRMLKVRRQAGAYAAVHPGFQSLLALTDNWAKGPGIAIFRWIGAFLNGRYNQQHQPVRSQAEPVGHSVRFGYLD